MPAIVGVVQPPPPPPPPPAVGPVRRVIEPPGVYRALWYPPDGSPPLDLNPPNADWWSLKANSGLGAVPVEVVTTDSPDGGVIVDFTRDRERTILWPVRMQSHTHLGLLAVWRDIQYRITQTKRLGPGRLVIERPDGTSRSIRAHYSSGLEGEPGDGTWRSVTAVVNWLCGDPYWQAPDPVVAEFRNEPNVDYLDPYPAISAGRVLGDAELVNPGDRAMWPTWRIRGPMTSLTAANLTRGQTFSLNYTLDEGEVLTITSRPLQVRGPSGQNLVSALGLLGGGGKPWRLDPRTTSKILFTVAGSEADSEDGADDGTRIWLSYPVHYETA